MFPDIDAAVPADRPTLHRCASSAPALRQPADDDALDAAVIALDVGSQP
jgi:hypothetical protein